MDLPGDEPSGQQCANDGCYLAKNLIDNQLAWKPPWTPWKPTMMVAGLWAAPTEAGAIPNEYARPRQQKGGAICTRTCL